jgi:hypothetical protein
VVAGQAHLVISSASSEFDQLIGDRPSDPTSAAACGDEHAGHFARSMLDRLYRARSDNPGFANRTQKDSSIAICTFGVVDIRQTRIDEVSHKRIRVTIKVLMPNGFDEPTSSRCIAILERPDCPVWSRAREVCHGDIESFERGYDHQDTAPKADQPNGLRA